nr:unnamed protein product [Callosobruchus analis]CAI5839897.1 unnamed protein product [Callosobruchus analis]
MFVKLLSIL